MDRQKLCLTYKFLIAFTLVFWWVPITFAQQKEKFVTKKSVLDPVIKARFPNSSVADIVDQSRGLEPVNLPDTTGYSIGDIINVKGELYELVAGDQQRNVYRGVIEDRAGSLLGDDTFEWETSPANIRVNLSRAVLGGSPPARIFIEFHSGNVYAETGIVRASGSDTTTTYRYHHDTSEPAIPSSGLSVGDTFDVSFYTNATKTTPLNIHSTSNRWEQDKRGDITGISIKDGGTLEGTANSVTGLNFTTGLNVTRAKGSNEVTISGSVGESDFIALPPTQTQSEINNMINDRVLRLKSLTRFIPGFGNFTVPSSWRRVNFNTAWGHGIKASVTQATNGDRGFSYLTPAYGSASYIDGTTNFTAQNTFISDIFINNSGTITVHIIKNRLSTADRNLNTIYMRISTGVPTSTNDVAIITLTKGTDFFNSINRGIYQTYTGTSSYSDFQTWMTAGSNTLYFTFFTQSPADTTEGQHANALNFQPEKSLVEIDPPAQNWALDRTTPIPSNKLTNVNTPRRVTELPAESTSLDRETVYLTADYTKSTGINITPQLFAGTELDSVTNPDAPSGIGTQGWYRKSDAGFTFGEINPDLPSDFILISDKRVYVTDDTQTNLAKIFLGTTEYSLTRVNQTNTKLFSNPGPSGPSNPLVDYYTIGGTGLPASGDWDDLRFETMEGTGPLRRNASQDILNINISEYNYGFVYSGNIYIIQDRNVIVYNLLTRMRNTSLDFTLPSSLNGRGGATIIGNKLFFKDTFTHHIRRYDLSTSSLDSISISNNNNGTLVSNSIDTIWIAHTSGNTAQAYNSTTGARESSKDITIGRGDWEGGVYLNNTLYFIDNNTRYARAYNATTRARESSKDINLGLISSEDFFSGGFDNNNLWFIEKETTGPPSGRSAHIRVYTQSTTPGTTIPATINIPKGNYENRNSDWAKSEFDAPEVQSDKDFKIAVEEQRPGTRQDKNLSFVASGSTFTTTNPFPGILRITYNNLSTDTDTYQRYTIFVPLDGFEDSKAPHLLKIGSVNYSLSYLETETNQAVYRSSVVKSTERITSAGTISAMNVQALDNSWFGETGGGKFLKTITKHDLSTFTNAIQEVHTLPGSPHEGQVIELLNDLTVPGGAILTAQESSGTSSASVNINGLFVGFETDARYDNGSAGGDLGSLDPTNSMFAGLVSFSNARASGTEANRTFFISDNGNTYAPTKVWINGIRYSVGSAVNRDYFPLTGLDGSFLKAGRKYYVNVEIANGDKLFADISYKAGTELIWDGIHWIKRLKGLSEEEVDNRITTKVAPFSILPKPTDDTKYIPADQICQEVATVSAYTALTKDNNRMYCIPETSQ